jgi:acyl carrier protein
VKTFDVRDHIEAFVRQQFNVSATDPNFTQETDLLEGGYVDSIGVVEVVSFLQAEYGIEIPDSDLMSDDFATVDGLTRITTRLVEGAEAAGGEGEYSIG